MITIKHMSQIEDAIRGNDYFKIYDKGDYYLAKYALNGGFETIEGDFTQEELDRRLLLRECRGIMFDKSGKVIRRPFQKFFNYGIEMVEDFDISIPHIIMEKHDGSMISPYMINGYLKYGTKAGESFVADLATKFASQNIKYNKISKYFIKEGYTPCFEYCTPQNQIVLEYEKDIMYFLAARHMESGEYMSHEDTQYLCEKFDIPHVEIYDSITDMDQFVEYVRNLKNREGFIARNKFGHTVKFKTEDYITVHSVVGDTMAERKIFQYAIEDKFDDIYGLLPTKYKLQMDDFIQGFNKVLIDRIHTVQQFVENNKGTDRRNIYDMVKGDPLEKVYMRSLANNDFDSIKSQILSIWGKTLNKKERIKENRHLVDGLQWKISYEENG
jgi:RNA ligase